MKKFLTVTGVVCLSKATACLALAMALWGCGRPPVYEFRWNTSNPSEDRALFDEALKEWTEECGTETRVVDDGSGVPVTFYDAPNLPGLTPAEKGRTVGADANCDGCVGSDTEIRYRRDPGDDADFRRSLFAHEVGHVMGLSHVPTDTLMNAFVQRRRVTQFECDAIRDMERND